MERKKLTLKEKREKILEQLENLNKQIVSNNKKILSNIFSDLIKDEQIYDILEARSQDKDFKEKLNMKVKDIILEIELEINTNNK